MFSAFRIFVNWQKLCLRCQNFSCCVEQPRRKCWQHESRWVSSLLRAVNYMNKHPIKWKIRLLNVCRWLSMVSKNGFPCPNHRRPFSKSTLLLRWSFSHVRQLFMFGLVWAIGWCYWNEEMSRFFALIPILLFSHLFQSKPTCFFSVIMNHYILPLPLLTGKPQKLVSVQAVHKVWNLIVGGIEKLDYQADAQLQKVLTDLVVKWIPQFRSVGSKTKSKWNQKWKSELICFLRNSRSPYRKRYQSHSSHVLAIANLQRYNLFWKKWLTTFCRHNDVKRINMLRSWWQY